MQYKQIDYSLIQELIRIMPYSIETIEEKCLEICGVEFDDLSYKDVTQIDSQIFQCSCCGYWFNNDFSVFDKDEEKNWCKACYKERNDYDDIEVYNINK